MARTYPWHRVFFDLDGVVLNSNAVIRQSYLTARTELEYAHVVPPEDVLGSEGVDWLLGQVSNNVKAAEAIKFRKDELYATNILRGRVDFMSGWLVAHWLREQGVPVGLLTGADFSAIGALHRYCRSTINQDWPFEIAVGRLSQQRKLVLMSSMNEPCVYVDDQPLRFPYDRNQIKYVHFYDHTAIQLRERVMEAMR